MNNKLQKQLIAPCGINCEICVGYIGYTMAGKRRKMTCIGCRPKDKSCAFLKKYCEKLTKKEVDFCFECNEFPCKHIEKLDATYQKKYQMSTIKNLLFIKEKGIEEFLKQQRKKYSCPQCGSIFCVHTKICYQCGWKEKKK